MKIKAFVCICIKHNHNKQMNFNMWLVYMAIRLVGALALISGVKPQQYECFMQHFHESCISAVAEPAKLT